MQATENNDRSSVIQNIFWMTLLSIAISLQLIIFVGFILSFSHSNLNFKSQLLSEYIQLLKPEPDIILYRVFVVAVFVFQMLGLVIFRARLFQKQLGFQFKRILTFEAPIVATVLLVIIIRAVYRNSLFLEGLFYFALFMTLIQKLFWTKYFTSRYSSNNDSRDHVMPGNWDQIFLLKESESQGQRWRLFSFILEAACLIFIWVVTYIPDRLGAIAQIYIRDSFYHFDAFVTGPAWGSFKGLVPGMDFYSQYGVGMPMVIAYVTKFFGPFSYENTFLTLYLLNGIYFSFVYLALRLWTKNMFLSIFGILLALKLQFFSVENSVLFIWVRPSTTVIRFFWDVFFFLFLWLFSTRQKTGYLFLASIITGLAIFYETDTGVYLLATLYAYLILLWICSFILKSKINFNFLLVCIFPLASVYLLFWVFNKNVPLQIFKGMGEYIQLISHGMDALPYFWPLTQKEYLSFLSANLIIVVHVFSFLFIFSLILLRQISLSNLFMVAISIYGLCLNHYYVHRTGPLSYRVVVIPFVYILCLWIHTLIPILKPNLKKNLIWLPLVGLIFLGSTQAFLKYPNVLNLEKYDLQKDLQEKEGDLTIDQDATFISLLTLREEKVALISSYDVALLMKADRKPFFYYFPLLNAISLNQPAFDGFKTTTKRQFLSLIMQLSEQQPRYVFIQKQFYKREVPEIYYRVHPWAEVMLGYLYKYYQPFAEGKYLFALCRK